MRKMDEQQIHLLNLIKPLFKAYNVPIFPASKVQIENFRQKAKRKGVPQAAIDELVKFYEVSNGIPCLDSVVIHGTDDETLYDLWDDNELWIGQRDMDMIRWSNGAFHMGHAGDLNYGEEYIFKTLYEALKKGFQEWHPYGAR